MKPILFNTEMVRAILEDRKTVTRRCIKKWDCGMATERNGFWKSEDKGSIYIKDYNFSSCWIEEKYYIKEHAKYQRGDILYVRETWAEWTGGYCYKTNCDYPLSFTKKWKPSIHMPKEAARVFLKVKDVRIERLSNMLGSDCVKEGINTFTKDGVLKKYAVSESWWNEFHSKHKSFKGTSWQDMPESIFEAFSYLWNSTVDKKELDFYGWNTNPCVFVYEFEVISKERAYEEDKQCHI